MAQITMLIARKSFIVNQRSNVSIQMDKVEVSDRLCKSLLPHSIIKRLAVRKVRQDRIYTHPQFFHQIVERRFTQNYGHPR
jgi:hypothetical protein